MTIGFSEFDKFWGLFLDHPNGAKEDEGFKV